VLELMMVQSFNPHTLTGLFPDIPVTQVPPWDVRQTFVTALQESQEARLAQYALDRLACVVRDGTVPSLPLVPQKPQTGSADWRTVFSRSTLGPDVVFMRGTHRSHAGVASYKVLVG